MAIIPVQQRRPASPVSPGLYSNSPPNPNNFYSLQMYHDTNNNSALLQQQHTQQKPSVNLYQSIQEVPYHPVDFSNNNHNNHNNHNSHNTNSHTHNNTYTHTHTQTHTHNNSHKQQHSGPVVQPIYATFGPESIFVTCPYCHHTDSTEIQSAIGSEALLWGCIIPGFGFLRKSKWDTRHRCKNCLNVIGIHYPA